MRPTILATHKYFDVGVAGDLVVFDLHSYPLMEQIAPNTYLRQDGRAEVSVGRSLSAISTPFQGVIEYCALKVPMGQFYECGTGVVARADCQSSDHRLIVTKR